MLQMLDKLEEAIEQEALRRNHEIIIAVFDKKRFRCCLFADAAWKLRKVSKHLTKVMRRILDHKGSPPETVSSDQLVQLKHDLIKEWAELSNREHRFTPCCVCVGCVGLGMTPNLPSRPRLRNHSEVRAQWISEQTIAHHGQLFPRLSTTVYHDPIGRSMGDLYRSDEPDCYDISYQIIAGSQYE